MSPRLHRQVDVVDRPQLAIAFDEAACCDWRVPFTECLIERDSRCAAAYTALMAPGTPVLLVRGQRLVGFNAQAVAGALSSPTP